MVQFFCNVKGSWKPICPVLLGTIKYLAKHERCKKRVVRKLYGIEAGIFFSFYLFGLAMTLQSAVEVTLKFFNRYLHLLLYVLVANIQMFSKRYKVASST